MAFSPNGINPRLVWLVDIEPARRLDTLTWTQAPAPNTSCWYVAHAEGAASRVEVDGAPLAAGQIYGTDDDPATRGTEWNLETHEFVSKAGLTQNAYPNGCLGGGLLITDNTTTGKFEGYSVATGLLVRSSAAHGFQQMRGLCSDGTYFYATGILTAGNVRAICKYQISDFSLVGTWSSTWPEFQSPWEVRYNGGFLYTWCLTVKRFFKINASTMVKDSDFAGPEYSPGSYYQIQSFDLDSSGTYIYAVGAPAAGSYFIKINASTGVLVAAGTTNIASTVAEILHYDEGAEERYYVGFTSGGSLAGKMNPATLDWYYSTAGVGLGHSPYGIAADEDYLYVFFEDNGVDRHLKNDIGSYLHAPSLEGCQATEQSFFYDSASGRLYVHITGGGSPAAGNPYLASYHWRHYGTAPEIYAGHPYVPILAADSIPSIGISTQRYHEGGTEFSFGSIRLLNGDGRFDSLLDELIWEAKRIKVRIGEYGKGDANYIPAWSGWTADIIWSDQGIEINTEDQRRMIS